ncbi:response regulator [Anatilimnocola sp. NA78]|uniref:response regulator n=1 Tax=Anatilimnocola sp. NA78 TaxID=3415683 RepID=UPI003CE45DBD
MSTANSANSGVFDTRTIEPLVYTSIVTTMVAVFVADYFTPLGIAVWIFFILPVALSLATWRVWIPIAVAVVATLLMSFTFYTDTLGPIPYSVALSNRLFGIFTMWVMAIVGFFFVRNRLAVRRQKWLQVGQMLLSEKMAGEQRIEQLGESILAYLSDYLGAIAGAMFVKDGDRYRRIATLGVPTGKDMTEAFVAGDGLLGQAAITRRALVVRDVPDGYLTFGSAFGKSKPRHLFIAPVHLEHVTNAVIELGFLEDAEEAATDLLDRVAESISVAVRSANYRSHLQDLLHETQRQAEELQAQSEELRVMNEELEEQSRALKESQARLELQQAELEQTNAQLEEQTQLLESQRDDLARAQTTLERRANELDQASRYKSEFLANMSHELRTPLNSSLILAKLLADNPQGNLSSEEVKYAQTILGAGNDLLNLINEILDLSKIEAGKMELRPESLRVAQWMESLSQTFKPLADQKGLTFQVSIQPDAPAVIETDRQRLEQVLKNLLSNAFKFTERGQVGLQVSRVPNGKIAIAVSDSGIGIAADQHEMIFEAFRQADGTTHRKYGGTGLGLSISRELARLLGGDIQLTSEPGRGSTFTLTVPEVYGGPLIASAAGQPKASPATTQAPVYQYDSPPKDQPLKSLQRARPRVEDDRDQLTGNSRIILIVEDDETFAKILYDLMHELHFECLIANTAEEALNVAKQFLPSAVVLDLGLPDHSGLSVLDRLKHDARTRHIPVHVISASDYSETAFSLGAVGYMLKPVKREALVDVFKGLETRLSQRMRSVLVVEDDDVQRDSMQKLLASHEVGTVGVGSAAECLAQLKEKTFDCMVLDLSLPDATGYSLLETLSREDKYAFPPVIVYTGRDLSADEEQKLRKYSKSIIIKGAKSPERLLDEVTLFLHQVVSDLPAEQQRMIEKARSRDAALEGRCVLVVEDDVRSVFALTSILEPRGAIVQIARNGLEALEAIEKAAQPDARKIDLVLMDVMMPEMDGLTATREIRKRADSKKLPVIMLTAKAMKDDQESCLSVGANDYMSKPIDVQKLLSLVRVWMPR